MATRYIQPQAGPFEIDWGNPLTRNLKLLVLAAGPPGAAMVLPLGNGSTNTNSGYGVGYGLGKATTPGGVFQTHGGGGYEDDCTLPNDFGTDAYGIYYFCVFYCVGSAASILLQGSGNSSQDDGTVTLNTGGILSVTANGNYSYTSGAIVGDGLHTVLFGNDRVNGIQQLWLDGVLITTGSSTAQQGFGTSVVRTGKNASGNVSIGIAGTGLGRGGDYATLAKALYSNPWQLFKAPRRVLRVSSGGGVAVAGAIADLSDSFSAAATPITATTSAATDLTDTFASLTAPTTATTSAKTDQADTFAAATAAIDAIVAAIADKPDNLAAVTAPTDATAAAVIDRADPLAASLSSSDAVAAALQDGQDAFAASIAAIATGLNIGGALTDGVDPFAAGLSLSAALMSGLMDSGDLFTAETAPVDAMAGARADGADALASSVTPLAGVVSATTDGGDPLTIAAAPIGSASVQAVDGADVFAGAAMPWAALTAALFDGVDVLAGSLQAVSAASANLGGAMKDGADIFAAIVQTILFGSPLISTPTPRNWTAKPTTRNWIASRSDMTTVIGPIDIEELRPAFFDFSGELKPGETLASVTGIEVTVQSGADPAPLNLLSGSPVINGSMVQQMMLPSINNNAYHLRAKAVSNLGSKLVVPANLSVVTL